MRIKRELWTGLLALLLAAPVSSKEDKSGATMDPAMVQALKSVTPGPQHQVLEPLIGNWRSTMRGRLKPTDKMSESKGTSEHTWIYGGRFVKMAFKSDWEGQTMEGTDYLGHDNIRGEYQLVTLHSMSTSIMHATGSYDEATKTLKFGGDFSCAMTGEKAKWFRAEWKLVNANENIYTSYFKGPDGKEFKSAEVVYKRMK